MGSCGGKQPTRCPPAPAPADHAVVHKMPSQPTLDRSPIAKVGDSVRLKRWMNPKEIVGAIAEVETVDPARRTCTIRFQEGQRCGTSAVVPSSELEVLAGADHALKPLQHLGMWRTERCKGFGLCSRPYCKSGPLCVHGDSDIEEDHWSCCGSTDHWDTCNPQFLGQVGDERNYTVSAAVAQLHAAQKLLMRVGDTVRVKPWVTTPMFTWGFVKPGDTGTVKNINGLFCQIVFSKQPNLWQGYLPEMWVVERDGQPLPGQHTGMWRQSGLVKVPCSTPGQQNGPLCDHREDLCSGDKDETITSHWSCCGNTQAFSLCGPDKVDHGVSVLQWYSVQVNVDM